MDENKDRIIILDHIKRVCKHHIPAPIIIIICLIVLIFMIPFGSVFHPQKVKGVFNVDPKQKYVDITTDKIKYTGYDMKNGLGEEYAYYYSMKDNKCQFVLIPAFGTSPKEVSDVKFKAKVIKPNASYKKMISLLSKDLSWTEKGLEEISTGYIISAADYHPYAYRIVLWTILVLIGVFLLRLILYIFRIRNPYLYPICSFLSKKDFKNMIDEAQEELDSENYLQINTTYITENYYIGLDSSRVYVIPLRDIIWVYRLGRRGFDIKKQTLTYTIRFITRDGVTIRVKRKSSDEAMAIMKSIKATEYEIITGHSDEKRRMVLEKIKQNNAEKTEEGIQ